MRSAGLSDGIEREENTSHIQTNRVEIALSIVPRRRLNNSDGNKTLALKEFQLEPCVIE